MMTSSKKVVVVFSGGLDSTVLLNHLRENGWEVKALHFQYGSKHNMSEQKSLWNVCSRLMVAHEVVELPLDSLFQSNLLQSGGEIPDGHYEEETMKQTVVPFRNGIMASIAVGYAESIGFEAIALGVHAGDHAIYPDCRETFMSSFYEAAQYGTEANIRVLYPFIHMSKTGIVELGNREKAPMELTWTCYKGLDKHCGTCGSCTERKEAFRDAGVVDPTEYME